MQRLLNLLTAGPWAILPATAETWCDLLERKMAGEAVDLAATLGAKTERDDKRGWELVDGLAVVPVVGELTKSPTLFNSGTTYARVVDMVAEAVAAPEVAAVLLDIDSPGGSVDGVFEAAHRLREMAAVKPIHAYANGQATSAAYLLASVCATISAPQAAHVGSIGVLAVHTDRSELNAKIGLKKTFLTAGKYKALGNDAEPLSDDARAYLGGRLAELYGQFLEAVTAGRPALSDAQPETWADGQIFLAAKALSVGLIDRVVSGREEIITLLSKEIVMDLNELKVKHPDVYAQVQTEAREGMVAADQATAAAEKAAADERGRVLGLAKAALGETAHAKLTKLIDTGLDPAQVTAAAQALGFDPAQAAAAQGDDAEAKAKAEHLQALKDTAQTELRGGPDGKDKGEGPQAKDWPSLVDAHAAEHKCSKSEAIKAIEAQHPGLRQKYLDLGA